MADWDFYRCTVNGTLAFITLDLDLYQSVPMSDRPFLHWFWIKLRQPNTDGLSSDDEYDDLLAYERGLEEEMARADMTYVGRITTDGTRQFYFYGACATPEDAWYLPVISRFPQYRYQYGSKADPTWSQYFNVLYPGEHGISQIRDRRSGAKGED